jgi:hypothetical protein
MTVGNQATLAQVNSQLSALSLSLRNNLQAITNLYEYVNAAGGNTGLSAGFTALGFSSPDAATASNLLGYMNTIAGCYNGTVQQGGSGGTGATDFNFGNALAVLWSGI